MAVRKILTYPSLILRRKAQPIEEIDAEVRRLAEDMVETMYAAPGLGLAAPQVGASRRLAVIDATGGADPDALMVLINPEITHSEGSAIVEEGCLSIPEVVADVERAERVVIRALALSGEEVEVKGEGLFARVIQHEIDHLEGRLFWDRLGKIKRELLKKKYKRLQEKGSE